MTKTDTPISVADIEEFARILNEHDEAKCESAHTYWNNLVCSEKVTHRMSQDCNGDAFLACRLAAEAKAAEMRSGVKCYSCKRPAMQCWTIRMV